MTCSTRADWEEYALRLQIEGRAFIQGTYCAALAGQTFESRSPLDGRFLAHVAACEAADAEYAVQGARAAFEQGVWATLSPVKRKRILLAWADLLEQHREELALLESLDMGKPIRDALSVDVSAAVRCIRWCAEAIDKLYGEVAPTGPDELGLITREPIGVVAVIVPWNFPLLMACWKLGPALAAGNSVVLKPSERAPLSAIRIAGLALQAGIPAGVFNVLPGYGATVGRALARHAEVDVVAFTGSTRTAKQLMIDAGESNLKRVWSEAGGKSAHIIFADAPDLHEAAQAAAAAICFNQGEVCTAGSRLLVEARIYDVFMPLLLAEIATWQPGHPLDPASNMGALVDEAHLNTVLGYIAQGQAEGAQLRYGGRRILQETGGFFVEPAVFEGVNNRMTIAREEIFGPVLAVLRFETFDEAIDMANDSPYGLAAALWTRDLSRAHVAARRLRAGSVWVNQYDGGDMTAPFGGFKQSGNGRDKSLHAFDKYTEIKATWIKL